MKKLSEIQRQHPAGIFIMGVVSLRDFFISPGTREYLIPFALFLWIGARNLPLIIPALLVLIFIMAFFLYGFLKWYNFYFYIKDGELIIHHGLWVRNKISLPRERIQAIDLNYNFLQKLFGVVSLNVQTAGESEAETNFRALAPDDAHYIIYELGEEKLKEEGEEEEKKQYQMSFSRLVLGGSTSSNFVFIFVIFSVILSQVMARLEWETMMAYIQEYSGILVNNAFSLFLGLLLLAWVISVITFLYNNYSFTLTVERDRLIIYRGFFEKQQVSIPYRRIQAIRIEEGWVRQMLGYSSVHVDSAGYGGTPGEATMLLPLLKNSEVNEFLANAVPSYYKSTPAITPPKKAFSRYMIRSLRGPLIIGTILAFTVHNLLVWPFVVYGGIMGYLRFQDAGAGLIQDHAVFRFRTFSRNTVIMRKHRIQAVDISRNFLQRIRKLATVNFFVASAGGGNEYSVADLERKEAFEFLYWVSPKISIDTNRLHEKSFQYLPEFPGFHTYSDEDPIIAGEASQ